MGASSPSVLSLWESSCLFCLSFFGDGQGVLGSSFFISFLSIGREDEVSLVSLLSVSFPLPFCPPHALWNSSGRLSKQFFFASSKVTQRRVFFSLSRERALLGRESTWEKRLSSTERTGIVPDSPRLTLFLFPPFSFPENKKKERGRRHEEREEERERKHEERKAKLSRRSVFASFPLDLRLRLVFFTFHFWLGFLCLFSCPFQPTARAFLPFLLFAFSSAVLFEKRGLRGSGAGGIDQEKSDPQHLLLANFF